MAIEGSSFRVDERFYYESYPIAPPEAELTDTARARRLELRKNPPGTTAKRALWIVHGMGQQIRFETLEQLAEGVVRAAKDKKIEVSPPGFREVRIGKTILQRVELVFEPHSPKPREVHLYECYWAAKTEGAVKLRDVIGFLWDGGMRGIVNYYVRFQRALFGTMTSYKLTWRTPAFLVLTLALLAALMAIDAMILATGATLTGISKTPADLPVGPLAAVAALVSAVAITFGVVLFLAETGRPTLGRSLAWGRAVRNLTWFAVAFTATSILTGAVLMSLMFWFRIAPSLTPASQTLVLALANTSALCSLLLVAVSRVWRRSRASGTSEVELGRFPRLIFYAGFIVHFAVVAGVLLLASQAFPSMEGAMYWLAVPSNWMLAHMRALLACILGPVSGAVFSGFVFSVISSGAWVWLFLALISGVARNVIVEYVGDVTAYVASNRVDRFDDIRTKIKNLAKESALAVYSAKARESDNFEYEKVAIIGHSLGSVIAYDTLNRLIADDALSGMAAGIVRRTCLLLTFGSPLDKTAFFFSMMGKNTEHIREQLATVVQPLIQDRDCREQILWRNVYSRNDIISGSLDFYQIPDDRLPPGVQQVRKVKNEKDEDALVPLVAHVEYWKNLTVWKRLLESILDLPPA